MGRTRISLAQALVVSSLVLGAILFFPYFAPWANLYELERRGGENHQGRASGWQLTIGTMTPLDEGEALSGRRLERREKKIDAFVAGRPWLVLGLLAPLGLLAAGIACLARRLSGRQAALAILGAGAAGVLTCSLALGVDYFHDSWSSLEGKLEARLSGGEAGGLLGRSSSEVRKQLATLEDRARQEWNERADTGSGLSLWLSLLTYLGLVGAAGVQVFGPRQRTGPAVRAASSDAEAFAEGP